MVGGEGVVGEEERDEDVTKCGGGFATCSNKLESQKIDR